MKLSPKMISFDKSNTERSSNSKFDILLYTILDTNQIMVFIKIYN